MTVTKRRRPVPDRARRRSVRALAARLGVAYSVAARLLAEGRREAPFAQREQRPFHARVRDTREAADLPLGRAARLTARFPQPDPATAGPQPAATTAGPQPVTSTAGPQPVTSTAGPQPVTSTAGRQPASSAAGPHRTTVLAMLYAVVLHESPSLEPAADELAWVAELGEEAAVDITCETLDRAARRLLDDDTWRLWTRIEAALTAGENNPDRRVRDAAVTLGRELRTVSLRGSLPAAARILDALLAEETPDAYSATRR